MGFVVRAGMLAFAVVTVLVMSGAPLVAGRSRLNPVDDSYEPGERATMVGYTGGGQLGWVDDGPFYAYLVTDPAAHENSATWPVIMPDDVPLGPFTLEETGENDYRAVRVSITFDVPDDLRTGDDGATYQPDDASGRSATPTSTTV